MAYSKPEQVCHVSVCTGRNVPLGRTAGEKPACAAGLDSGEEREGAVPGLEENGVQRRLPGGTGFY